MAIDYYRDDTDFGDLFGDMPNELSPLEAKWFAIFKETRGDRVAADNATGNPFRHTSPSLMLQHELRAYRNFSKCDPLSREQRITNETADVAFADVRDLLDPDTGAPRPIQDLPRHVAAAISAVDVTTDDTGRVTIKYKMHNKLVALDALAKQNNMYKENNKIEADIKTEDVGDKDIARRLAFVLRRGIESKQNSEE